MSISYAVILEKFAERHYTSKFKKKYKGAWDATWVAIQEEFKRFDALLGSKIAETITNNGSIRICKTEFRVHGTEESRHASGNRCIVVVHNDTCVVNVLFIYNKSYLGDHNETAAWQGLIKENYPQYSKII
ncbi:MAG: hypothetical protein Q8P07_05350 [bacterium]|nr:hypothetical protein [bacterium]